LGDAPATDGDCVKRRVAPVVPLPALG